MRRRPPHSGIEREREHIYISLFLSPLSLCRGRERKHSIYREHILTIPTELDLTQVNWIAATILMNVERDVRRAYHREANRQNLQVPFDLDQHGGICEFADPDLAPDKLLAELTQLIGEDADLVIRVVVDGYTQAEAGKGLGLSEPAARKRFQRALKRLRAQVDEKS